MTILNKSKIFIIIALLLCLGVYVSTKARYVNKKLKVLIRYDDYSEYSNIELETELFKIVQSKAGGLLVSVIPYPGVGHPLTTTEFNRKLILNKKK